jgi:hypothetical protein
MINLHTTSLNICFILAAHIILAVLMDFANSGITDRSNGMSFYLTPEQKTTICNTNNP